MQRGGEAAPPGALVARRLRRLQLEIDGHSTSSQERNPLLCDVNCNMCLSLPRPRRRLPWLRPGINLRRSADYDRARQINSSASGRRLDRPRRIGRQSSRGRERELDLRRHPRLWNVFAPGLVEHRRQGSV